MTTDDFQEELDWMHKGKKDEAKEPEVREGTIPFPHCAMPRSGRLLAQFRLQSAVDSQR